MGQCRPCTNLQPNRTAHAPTGRLTVELHDVLGLRWSDWMSIILFVIAGAYFVWASLKRPGREESVYVDRHDDSDSGAPVQGPVTSW